MANKVRCGPSVVSQVSFEITSLAQINFMPRNYSKNIGFDFMNIIIIILKLILLQNILC